jgi:hypothetical protein
MPQRPEPAAVEDGPRLHGRCPHCKQQVAVKFTETVFCQFCGREFALLDILCVAPRGDPKKP